MKPVGPDPDPLIEWAPVAEELKDADAALTRSLIRMSVLAFAAGACFGFGAAWALKALGLAL